jgi:small subunit ribosomal protein S1
MTNLSENISLDEGYWQSLLAEAERMAIAPTRIEAEARDFIGRPIGHDTSWATLERMQRAGDVFDVEVTGCNRGGLIVVFRGMRGFIPSSHVHSMSPDCDEGERRTSLAGNIGKRLSVRILELDPAQDRIIFSERVATDEEQPREIPPVLVNLKAGDQCRGTVTNLTSFGAFIDLGGYEGLVHVSELAWSRVNHPRDMLHIGQEVDVYVMSISPGEGRIALSLKRARQSPWDGLEQRYRIGQIVHGTVTNVVQFGAFVKVEDDLEGLVHVSELADGNFLHARSVVQEGDAVTAKVIGVDARQRRLALSMRDID